MDTKIDPKIVLEQNKGNWQTEPKNPRKNPCDCCHYFDNSKHVNDERTKHAGLCNKHCEIVFKNDTCKQYFSAHNLPSAEIFNQEIQTSLNF